MKNIKIGEIVKFNFLGTQGIGKVKRVNPVDVMVEPINHPTLKISIRVHTFEKINQ